MGEYLKRRNTQILIVWGLICLVTLCTLGTIFTIAWSMMDQNQPTSVVPTPTTAASPTAIVIVVTSTPAPSATPLMPTASMQKPSATPTLTRVTSTGEIITVPPYVSETPIKTGLTPISGGDGLYIVNETDTLDSISAQLNVKVEDIRAANGMIGDNILPGQQLLIPQNGAPKTTPYKFSTLNTNDYQGTLKLGRFNLHYVPGTYPAYAVDALAALEQKALDYIESLYKVNLSQPFEVYVAGSLFQSPDQGLRGRSYSSALDTFFLYDGSGNPTDEQYIAVHELTHVYMWNAFGAPATNALSEGAAVYTGLKMVEASQRIPLDKFCAAHLKQNALPHMTDSLSFLGHNYDLVNYYAAGCFYGYLLETYGLEKIGKVYASNNYAGVYGRSLADLDKDWRDYLASSVSLDGIDAGDLVTVTAEVTGAYKDFFPKFNGTPQQVNAYREFDRARIALLENRLDEAKQHLQAAQDILKAK